MEPVSLNRAAAGIAYKFAAAPAVIAGLALSLLMVMTFADVILRSIFSMPLSFSGEVTVILMVVIVFAAMPMVILTDGHIVVNLLDSYFSARAALVRDTLVDLTCMIAVGFPAVRILDLAARSRGYGEVTVMLQMPRFYLMYFVAVSLFSCVGFYIVRIGTRWFLRARPGVRND